ncbi:MAG: M14 family metallopeptidase [Flammeovirgaceae bacterium]
MRQAILSILIFSILISFSACQKKHKKPDISNFKTAFEQSEGVETETYASGIAFWKKLDEAFPQLKLLEYGTTDAGLPLHLAVLSSDEDFDPSSLQKEKKLIYMINNAIHPGEPDGVDATIMLYRDLLFADNLEARLGEVVLIAIPFYNIGGALNRNTTSRANQNGPPAYGFRGNAQNLDLNRDFIKMDSKNAQSFAEIFQEWNPDLFVDTHVSNGADYQYVLTYLTTQEHKLGPKLGNYMRSKMIPNLKKQMMEKGQEMTPYVNVWGSVPDSGYVQFIDHPRYSTGYASLFHTLSFMTETHMLKSFAERTKATYAFLESLLKFGQENSEEIKKLRKEVIQESLFQKKFPILWEVNRAKPEQIEFKGYEASYLPSEVTTGQRLFYDRSKPFTKTIPLYNTYESKLTIKLPRAYIIPQAWHRVIKRLKKNAVAMERLKKDTTLEVGTYRIVDYKSRQAPYEGHYLHSNVQVEKESKRINFRKGDYLIHTNQRANRFLVNVLEPQAVDSYFNWNFFDIILQRKEGYSAYVFEDKAKELLAKNPQLKKAFDDKMLNEPDFAKSPGWQLFFIYSKSELAEAAYMRYPVYRVEK